MKETKVIERARELGYSPIIDTIICARFAPYSEGTAIDRGMAMLKDSMKLETPDSFYKILFCAENELVAFPLSWWTGGILKGEHQAIAYTDITGFQAPTAKALSWQGTLTTKDTVYELVISDEKLAKLNLTGGSLLKGDWRQYNLPKFIEKLNEECAG